MINRFILSYINMYLNYTNELLLLRNSINYEILKLIYTIQIYFIS